MKNLTIALPDDVYRNARVEAAHRGTSVSALVRDYLMTLVDDDREARRLENNRRRRELVERIRQRHAERGEVFSMKENQTREEIYNERFGRR